MSSKIVQIPLPFDQGKQDKQLISSLKCLFAGHNELQKNQKEIKSFHDCLLYYMLETQDAVLALSDRLHHMETTIFEIESRKELVNHA